MFRSKYESEEGEATFGLWQGCASTSIAKVCLDICPVTSYDSGPCPKTIAARAFVTLACILSGISALCLFACAVTGDNTNRTLLLAGKGLVFVCLVMGIIGVAVGISGAIDIGAANKLDVGAAAIIGIVALIFNLGGAIVSLLIK